jgi:hypothetical protein
VSKPWSPSEDDYLRAVYGTMPGCEVAKKLGKTPAAIRNRAYRLGVSENNAWTEAELNTLKAAYEAAGSTGVLKLDALAESFGRPKSSVCKKARDIGLETSYNRKKVEVRKDRKKFATEEDYRAWRSECTKNWQKENGHPRGMKGKKHTPEVRAIISQKGAERWASMTEEEKLAETQKQVDARRAKGTKSIGKPRGSWKAGWREIGGKRNYYRSRWEANYARYLQWLKEEGYIKEWEHEPETFWFDGIKRGVRSYLPDFRVWENDGSSALHEVKGWMDARSKTTIARMGRYHPHERLIVIDGVQYRSIRQKVMHLIEGWEDATRDNYG